MPINDRGITIPLNSVSAGVIQSEVFGIAINEFINRDVLLARLPKAQLDTPSFLITNDNYRPRSSTVGSGGIDNSSSTTSLPVADGSIFQKGDILEIEGEQMLVTADPTANTLTVQRPYAGTSAASHSSGTTVYLITNARQGNEVDLVAISRIPAATIQYAQTVQEAYQTGGALASVRGYNVGGFSSALERDKFLTMRQTMDDYESASLYGKGQAQASGTLVPAMKGLRTLITTNRTTTPDNAGSYGPDDLVRDTIMKCADGGGRPNFMIVSTNFILAFAKWGFPAQRLEAGANVFGTPIDLFEVTFMPGVSFVPHPLLRPYTMCCLSLGDGENGECRQRIKRPLEEYPRAPRGDAIEGDFLMEGAIELDNEAHHAWVEGITAFAA